MTIDLRGRSFLKEIDSTKEEFTYLITESILRNVALIVEKTSTRTRSAFEVGGHDQGAHVTYIGPDDSQLGRKESIKDTARVLGRMYDGIEYRSFGQDDVETLARYAGVPVWNGLTTATAECIAPRLPAMSCGRVVRAEETTP
jgi:ornithine carbamoyltransferase